MPRDYETPDDYADHIAEREANDDWCELQRHADKEEALVRRWEERREMPYEDAPEPEHTLAPDCPSCDAPGHGRYSCPRCGWHRLDPPMRFTQPWEARALAEADRRRRQTEKAGEA